VLNRRRGGGSLEDLWSFNDERVARAIFASLIPVAPSAETDVTIADFVADLRAPTPSAAAEVVSRNQLELLRQLQNGQQRLEMAMDYFLPTAPAALPSFIIACNSSTRSCVWRVSKPCWIACASG
jgi:exodeoxyribonuclease VII large subunit